MTQETLADIMFLVDTGFIIKAYYAKDSGLLFTAPDNFLNKNFMEVLPEAESAKFSEVSREVMRTKRPHQISYDLPLEEGMHRFVSEYLPCFDKSGEVADILVLIKDISALEREEKMNSETREMFRSIFETARSGIVFRSAAGEILECNDAFCGIIEGTREKIRMKSFADFLHPDDVEAEHALVNALLENRSEEFRMEKRIITFSGTIKWVDSSVSVIRDKDANPVFFVSIINDISEAIHAKHELRQMSDAKDKLMSIIGHDLRSPLTSIHGLIDMLSGELKEEQVMSSQILEMMKASVSNAQSLLENLLEWVSTQNSELRIKPEPTGINALFDESIRLLWHNAESKSISLVNASEHQVTAEVDRNMIRTIIRNLMFNAIKFTNPGGTVTCNTWIDGKELCIRISDNGVGMDEEMIQNLFTRSTQKSNYGTANEKGSGLGFAICKDFVQKHSGHIEVQSEKDTGSSFTVKIPV